jgi:hypothetical protein
MIKLSAVLLKPAIHKSQRLEYVLKKMRTFSILISLRIILINASYLCPLRCGLWTNTLCAFLIIFKVCYMFCPSHSSGLVDPNNIWKSKKYDSPVMLVYPQ